MLPGFIASLIKRRSASRLAHHDDAQGLAPTAPGGDAGGTPDVVAEKRVTVFWHDAIRFVPLDDLIKDHPRAPELTLDEAASGRVAVSVPDTQSDADATEEGREVVAAIGLAPRDWRRLRGRSARARYLLALPAQLTDNGYLLPKGAEVPFFNPARIQSNDQRNDVFITTTEIINEWLDAHALPNSQEWPPLWSYALDMLAGATYEPAANLDAARHRLAAALGLPEAQDWIIKIVPAASSNQATAHLAAVYGRLLEAEESTGADIETYRRLVSGFTGSSALSGRDAANADAQILAHIDAFRPPGGSIDAVPAREIFPLDPSQRQAVRHACRLSEGEILAVNGPPGTGKTATLRAVIASYWVQAALTQDRPPIIVGCGATNQAVTNITEAFIDAPHRADDYPLAGRWSPFVSSYGMFFASDHRGACEQRPSPDPSPQSRPYAGGIRAGVPGQPRRDDRLSDHLRGPQSRRRSHGASRKQP